MLESKAIKKVPDSVLRAVGKKIGRKPGEVTTSNILSIRNNDFSRLAKIDPSDAAKLKLKLMGVKLKKSVKHHEPKMKPTRVKLKKSVKRHEPKKRHKS